MIFLDQAAAGGLVGVDKLCQFGTGMCPKEDMDVVRIMVPLLDLYVIAFADPFEDGSELF